MYKLSSFQPANNQSTMMRVIRNKCRIWNNEWQLINVHKKSLQVLSGDWRQVNNLPATDVDPKIICVNSAETVPAKGAWLRSYTPSATTKQQNMMTNLEGIVRTWKDRQMPCLALKERENYGYSLNEPRVRYFRFWMFMGKKKRHLSFGNHVVNLYFTSGSLVAMMIIKISNRH